MAAPNEDWIPLFPTIELAPGRARYIAVGGSELAVFHLAEPDRFVVINNSCPHAGGNLSAGTIAGAEVTCPWHDWTFNLDTAECTMNEKVCVKRHASKVEGGRLFVRLS